MAVGKFRDPSTGNYVALGGGMDTVAGDARYLRLTGGDVLGEVTIPQNVAFWLNAGKTVGVKYNTSTQSIDFVMP